MPAIDEEQKVEKQLLNTSFQLIKSASGQILFAPPNVHLHLPAFFGEKRPPAGP